MRSRSLAAGLCAASFWGCIEVPAIRLEPAADAGVDARPAAGIDAGIDAGIAAGSDASPEPGLDAGVGGDGPRAATDAAPPDPDVSAPQVDLGPPAGDAAVAPATDASRPDPDGPAAPRPPEAAILRVEPQSRDRRFGASLAVVADQNGDGFADVVVGAPPATPDGQVRGAVLLLDGRTGEELAAHVTDVAEDDYGATLTVGALLGDERLQVAVSAPSQDGGRGAIYVLSLPALQPLAWTAGPAALSGLGAALAVVEGPGGVPALLATTPGHLNPQLPFYRLSEPVAGTWSLERALRVFFAIDVAVLQLGLKVQPAPPAAPGGWPDAILVGVHALRGPERRVLRYARGEPGPLRSEYLVPRPGATTGSSLLVVSEPEPLLLVGNPGDGEGTVTVFPRDGGANVMPQAELTPPQGLHGYGVALARSPSLWPAPGGPDFGICIGANAGNMAQGAVDCRGPMDEWRLTLRPDAPAAGFGTALSGASGLDPDGTWLLAVGAPDAQIRNDPMGAVFLVRVTPGR